MKSRPKLKKCVNPLVTDLAGQTFGKLTVLRQAERPKDSNDTRAYWLCKCACDGHRRVIVRGRDLRRGMSTSCGCSRVSDLRGRIFGRLTVLRPGVRLRGKKSAGAFWECRCTCGRQVTVPGAELRRGRTKSCPLCRVIDLTGQIFGRLTVVGRAKAPRNRKSGRTFWLCQCTCGRRIRVDSGSLRTENTRSCGCLGREHLPKWQAENKDRWLEAYRKGLTLERNAAVRTAARISRRQTSSRQKSSRIMKRLWQKLSFRVKMERAFATSEKWRQRKVKMAEISRQLWRNPEFRRRTVAAMRAANRKRKKSTRPKDWNMAYRSRQLWQDPEYRRRTVEARWGPKAV